MSLFFFCWLFCYIIDLYPDASSPSLSFFFFVPQSSVPIGTRILRRKPTDVKDVETHYGWSRALELLDIPADLSSKFDLKWMQENLTLDKFSTVKVPYVLVGVKSLERVGSEGDVYCDVEDPTGNILVIYLILYVFGVYIPFDYPFYVLVLFPFQVGLRPPLSDVWWRNSVGG